MKAKKFIIFLILLLIAYVGITYATQTKQKNPLITLKNLVMTVIQKKQAKESKLIIPDKKLMPSSLENEDFFKDHWESDRGYFMLIQDDIVSREGPSIKASKYEKLFKTERVRILYKNVQASDIEGELRYWVFIGSESGKTLLGWVFKDQLISKKDFIQYEPLEKMNYIYDQGTLKSRIIIEKNGRFNIKWKASGRGLFLKGSDDGQLLIYEDIIWARKDEQDFLYNFFITDATNQLMHEYRFREDRIKMEIFTMPKEGERKK